MADIQFEVENLDAVEEDVREAYVEKDGKFRLDPDKYYELKAKPLIAKNRELIGDKKNLFEQVKKLEKVKGSIETDVEKVAAEKDQTISELKKELRENKIWAPVQQLALKHGVLPDMVGTLMKVLRADERFDLDEAGKLIFRDENGNETAIKPQRAFEVYLSQEYPRFFAASQSGGGGAKNDKKSGGGGKRISRSSFNAMSPSQQHAAMKEGAQLFDD